MLQSAVQGLARSHKGDVRNERSRVTDVETRRFEDADEIRTFEHGTFELITIGGVTVGRARYEPGWV